MPPLPFNPFPGVKVIPLGGGNFAYDDTEIDYAAVEELQKQMGLLDAAPLYGSDSLDYGTNTYIAAVVVQGNTVHLTLSNALPDTAYDVYFTPTLNSGFFWRLHFRGATNQVEFQVAQPPTSCGFFRVAVATDSDEDGITDGYEVSVTKTDPYNPDSDANGIWDGYEDFDGDGALNFEEFNLRTDPDNADSNLSGVSDGKLGGSGFLTDGIDNNKDGVVDESAEGNIAPGPNLFAGELKIVGKLRGDNQAGIPSAQLLLPFVVCLTDTNGNPVANGTPVAFSAFSPSSTDISYLLSETTAYTGSNGFAGQAQTYLTLAAQTGRYRVLAVGNGITNEFSAETVTPVTNYMANARYEPAADGEVVAGICHMRFVASGADTNVSHVVGAKLASESNPTGIVTALYETFPGSGVYVGSCKTEALQALGSQFALNSVSAELDAYAGPDADTEYASADNAEESGSNFSDSDQSDSQFANWGCTSRGKARAPLTSNYYPSPKPSCKRRASRPSPAPSWEYPYFGS